MCNSAQWWVAFKGGEVSPARLWALLLVLGAHHCFIAFNHALFVFQAHRPSFTCQEEAADGTFVYSSGCQRNCTGKYVFDGNGETIVSEWSLVCDRAALRPLMATVYFLGVAVGALVCGFLADRLGRRTIMVACLVCQASLGVAVAYAPDLDIFALLRTAQGVFVQGVQSSTFTLLIELFPGRLRTVVGVVQEIYWALGLAMLSGLAYLLPNWRDLQLAVSVPTIVTLLMLPWIPESRLWLASRGQSTPFRRGLPGHGSYREKSDEEGASVLTASSPAVSPEPGEKRPNEEASSVSSRDLITEEEVRVYTFCMNGIWFTVPLAYYVTTFGMPLLTGDRFLNFGVGAALELVAYCCTFVALSRFGRRGPLAAFLATSAVACFAVSFILVGADGDGGLPVLVLVLACKATLVSSFCSIFIYTGELFPTPVRAAALGICGFVGRVGNLLSPQVVHLGDEGRRWLPFMLIAVLLLVASSSTFLLPETLGQELPATLEDARRLRRGRRRRKQDAGEEAQPLNNAGDNLLLRNPKLTLEDYKVPDWKSDIPQLEPDKVQTAKKRGSMSALELGQGLLEELNRTPATDRTERTRSMYLETNLDDPLVGEERREYKTTVSSAV